jgi:hypothetical protein
MSSWVAPSIAAELWGISVEQVLADIASGSIPSYVDGQFLFVDVTGKNILPSTPMSPSPRSVVTDQEIAALTFQPRDSMPTDSFVQEAAKLSSQEISFEEVSSDELPFDEEEIEGRDVGAWRTARSESSRRRRPPHSEAA